MYWYAVRFGNGHNELVIPETDPDLPKWADIPHRSLHHAIHAVTHAMSENITKRGKWHMWKGMSYGYYVQWDHDAMNLRATWLIFPVLTHVLKDAMDEQNIATGPKTTTTRKLLQRNY